MQPRSRHYVFLGRRSRQRVAQRLGAGWKPAEVAAAERTEMALIHRLLADRSFQDLVEHYRDIDAMPAAERLAKLAKAAMELLELAVAGGDHLAAIFILSEQAQGRDPAMTLAAKAVQSVAPSSRERPPACPPRERSLAPAGTDTPSEKDATHSQPIDAPSGSVGEVDLPALTTSDAQAALRAKLAVVARRLRERLVGEAERRGTGRVDGTIRAFAPRCRWRPAEPHPHRMPVPAPPPAEPERGLGAHPVGVSDPSSAAKRAYRPPDDRRGRKGQVYQASLDFDPFA